MQQTIALDAMGGDHGLSVTVPAALRALDAHPSLNLILVGDQHALADALASHGRQAGARLRVQHASQIVEMHEPPSQALRGKKDSSMRVAINLVKDGTADACVSAGNTGALMATARFVLRTLPGIERPAICGQMPTVKGITRVLDLGANVDSTPEQMFQFAVMGSVLCSEVTGIESPTIGLLNVGEEEIKGNERVKAAARLLADSDLNYQGFVEGDDIFAGTVDIVVCDGFVGNVALKSSEGVARMITHYLRGAFMRTLWTKLLAILVRPVLRDFRARIDPRNYNGASLLGLKGCVVKSHGGADEVSFANAIDEAVREIEHQVPSRIGELLGDRLLTRQAG